MAMRQSWQDLRSILASTTDGCHCNSTDDDGSGNDDGDGVGDVDGDGNDDGDGGDDGE